MKNSSYEDFDNFIFLDCIKYTEVNSCDLEQFDDVDTLNIWMKEFGLKNSILDKMTPVGTFRLLLNRGWACAYRGRSSATTIFEKLIQKFAFTLQVL